MTNIEGKLREKMKGEELNEYSIKALIFEA
jgi:hypothetical protein